MVDTKAISRCRLPREEEEYKKYCEKTPASRIDPPQRFPIQQDSHNYSNSF